ncbi:aconitase X swivel domain-containing protein [Pseudomonas sp. TB1-B1]|uniref:aconitase X swivel domain-containing protein n=1 Tax=Pseudomonas sp. TB1-B1 TaxID=2985515 RepID=UPI003B639CEE
MLSFWRDEPATGEIVNRHHPLSGESLTGKIFALPKGKGSSTGSAVLLNALHTMLRRE